MRWEPVEVGCIRTGSRWEVWGNGKAALGFAK